MGIIIGFVLGAAALLFITQNTAVVPLMFLNWQFESSIAALILLALLVGALITFLMVLPSAIGDAFHMRRLEKHNDALAREAEAQRQAAHDAETRLAASESPRPDVIDLTEEGYRQGA